MEWKNEPNRKEWKHAGLKCLILRNTYLGHLCGYVEIPHGHLLYGKSYSSIAPASLLISREKASRGLSDEMVISAILSSADNSCASLFSVHGGITYSGTLNDRKTFWYGFDCSHCDDLSPYISGSGVYRNMAYVKNETESLARQIAALKAGYIDTSGICRLCGKEWFANTDYTEFVGVRLSLLYCANRRLIDEKG